MIDTLVAGKRAHLAGAVSHLSRRKSPSTFISTFHNGKSATRPGASSGPSDFAIFAKRLRLFDK